MTRDTVVLVAVLMLMGGWYGRKLWQANDDVRSLKQRLGNARRAFRRVLVVAVLVGAAIYGAAYHWIWIHGG